MLLSRRDLLATAGAAAVLAGPAFASTSAAPQTGDAKLNALFDSMANEFLNETP